MKPSYTKRMFKLVTSYSEWSVLLRAWAEEVQRLIDEFRTVRDEHLRLIHAQEHEGDWAVPDQQMVGAFRRHWIASQKVVWSAHHFNRWRKRHAGSQHTPQVDANLKHLRDALEHLDEAVWLDEFSFGPPGATGNAGRGLRALPGGSLMFSLGFDDKIMDLVDVGELRNETDSVIAMLDQEQEQAWEAEAEDLWERGYFDDVDF